MEFTQDERNIIVAALSDYSWNVGGNEKVEAVDNLIARFKAGICQAGDNRGNRHVWAYPYLDRPGVCYYCNKNQEVAA